MRAFILASVINLIAFLPSSWATKVSPSQLRYEEEAARNYDYEGERLRREEVKQEKIMKVALGILLLTSPLNLYFIFKKRGTWTDEPDSKPALVLAPLILPIMLIIILLESIGLKKNPYKKKL